MAFPKTIDELRESGYEFVEHKPCKGKTCKAVIEFWKTPKGKFMPFDVEDGQVTPHWANCPDQEAFRK